MNGCFPRFALAWLVSVSVVGVGCTSAPVRYYTLTPPPATIGSVSDTPLEIDVRVVHVPQQLNRSELMVRTGPTEVMLLENERWASPVNDEIRDALRLELRHGLGRMTGSRSNFARVTLDIEVQRLDAEFGRHAVLEASWSATWSANGSRFTSTRATNCVFRADKTINSGYAEIVEAYQREVAALADTILAVLTRPRSGIDAPCQTSIEGSARASGSKDP